MIGHKGVRLFSVVAKPSSPIPGFYRHYKNNDLYKVLGCVIHTETSEHMVLYQAVDLCGRSLTRNPDGMAFVRPIDMFVGTVEHKGKQMKRFEHVLDI